MTTNNTPERTRSDLDGLHDDTDDGNTVLESGQTRAEHRRKLLEALSKKKREENTEWACSKNTL